MLCVQGLAQRHDAAKPHAVSLSLPLGVLSVREGPASRAQVASELDLPCPSPGAADPLGGIDDLPCPSPLCGGAGAAGVQVVPSANRPWAADMRPLPGAEPALPRPHLDLLGVEVRGDQAITGRLPAAVARPFLCAAGGGGGSAPSPLVWPLPLGSNNPTRALWLPAVG